MSKRAGVGNLTKKILSEWLQFASETAIMKFNRTNKYCFEPKSYNYKPFLLASDSNIRATKLYIINDATKNIKTLEKENTHKLKTFIKIVFIWCIHID